MMGPVSLMIRSHISQLQPGELKVAEYVLANAERTMESSAQELADTVGVARSTVVRSCQTLGFTGYQQLRLMLAKEIGALEGADDAVVHSGDFGEVLRVFSDMATAISSMPSLLDENIVNRSIELIDGANQILIVANGLSSPVGQDFVMRLSALGLHAHGVVDAIAQQIAVRNMSEEDLCIVITGSGANTLSLNATKAAADAGAHIIVITAFTGTAFTEYADATLVVSMPGLTFRTELMETTRIPQSILINALVSAVRARRGKRARTSQDFVLDVLGENLLDPVPSETSDKLSDPLESGEPRRLS